MLKYRDIISKMTLEEKALLTSGRDTWRSVSLDDPAVPGFFLSDGPHGIRKQEGAGDQLGLNRSVPATCFPTASCVANSWDPDLAGEVGAALGEEAATLGVDVLLGPGLNIKRSPLCGRNFEYFSEDPYLSGKMAAGYIQGIQSRGVSACPKHFAANRQEERRMAMDSVVDERTLREIYLTGFEIAVREGRPRALMTSYNRVNGTYANEDPHLLKDILRGEWGFDGMVVSDWGGSNDHTEGVRCGASLEMPSTGRTGKKQIINAVKEGRLCEDDLDERVDEILRIAFETGKSADHRKKFDADAHNALARRAAAQGTVLLKNDDKILPLSPGSRVALIGDFAETPRYQGAGSSLVNPIKEPECIKDLIGSRGINCIGYARGYKRCEDTDAALTQEAMSLAEKADIVLICAGLDEISESEGLDRAHMELPKAQNELINAVSGICGNTVILLSGGSACALPWLSDVRAVVHGFLGGQAGASAMLDVITGKTCPAGKLAESWPLELKDVPCAPYYPAKEKTCEYREALFAGYRYYDTKEMPVLFPFGYGLSYTDFEYSNLNITEAGVSFTVRNTGAFDGAETAQLYIGHDRKDIFGPKKELKGFAKMFLKRGQERRVNIEFDDKSFRYFNVKTDSWEKEGGSYRIYIGASSADIRLEGKIQIQGTDAPLPYEKEKLPSYYNADIADVPDSEFKYLYGRKLPPALWDKTAPLDKNDALCQMYYAKGALARLVCRVLRAKKEKAEKKGKPDLNILFIYNMTFRGISKMTGGAIDDDMVSAILEIVNGHAWKGLWHFIAGALKNRRSE